MYYKIKKKGFKDVLCYSFSFALFPSAYPHAFRVFIRHRRSENSPFTTLFLWLMFGSVGRYFIQTWSCIHSSCY